MKRWIVCSILGVGALAAQTITPTVECVTYSSSLNQLTVTFGYVSSFSTTELIGIGELNFMSPPPANRSQTTTFAPGTTASAFQVTFNLGSTSSLSWHLEGNTATATNDPGNYCNAPGGSCWDTNSNGTCDPSEDINGDGVCDARDCQGRTGATGPQGPQGPTGATGSQGAAGVSLQSAIQVVTNATTSATATATCGASQVAINGGGVCSVPNTNSISGRMASSQPSGSTGWTISCSTGQATAVALCAPGQ